MANITILNTSSNLSSKTLLAAENSNTVTGLLTFSRNPSAPFAVSASSAVVPNLDADKLDGLDSTAFPLLSASNIFTVNGEQAFVPGTATSAAYHRFTNTGGNSYIGADSSTGGVFAGGNYAMNMYTDNAVGIVLTASNVAGGIKFRAGSGALRWGIDSSGNWTFGSSAHIALGAGTPTISSGFGAGSTITGTSYAFKIVTGTGLPTTGTVSFGTTFSSAPMVVVSGDNISAGVQYAPFSVSTTGMSIQTGTAWTSNVSIWVHVFGV